MSQHVEIVSELSPIYFLAQCSDKGPLIQHLRPNIEPIYHHFVHNLSRSYMVQSTFPSESHRQADRGHRPGRSIRDSLLEDNSVHKLARATGTSWCDITHRNRWGMDRPARVDAARPGPGGWPTVAHSLPLLPSLIVFLCALRWIHLYRADLHRSGIFLCHPPKIPSQPGFLPSSASLLYNHANLRKEAQPGRVELPFQIRVSVARGV